MIEILKNMFRRKLRTSLTIFGIMIGIFALTIMGSMAEKMNRLMEGGVKYVTGEITVSPKGGYTDVGGMIPYQKLNEIKNVQGVEAVQANISMMLEENQSGFNMGMPPMLAGIDLNSDFRNKNYPDLEMESGSLVKKGDKGKVSVGKDIALDKKIKTGDKMKIRGKEFEVKGIIAKTYTGPDKMVYMSLEDAQGLFVESQPYLKGLRDDPRVGFKQNELLTAVSVSWKDGEDPEAVAKRIRDQIKDISVMSPKEFAEQFKSFSRLFNMITLSSAIIALIVGSLSVINTMIMSISERTREIGVKKAVGAKTKDILFEYLLEAGVIGLIGGILGAGLGALVVYFINSSTKNIGDQIFLVTPRIILNSVLFAIILGIVAGIYPAVHAVRLNIVKAIREE